VIVLIEQIYTSKQHQSVYRQYRDIGIFIVVRMQNKME